MTENIFSLKDLIGYIIALISIAISFVIYHKSKISKKDFDNKIEQLNNEKDFLIEKFDNFAKSIHDIAFNKLLEIKNVPPDYQGMARQRDSLSSILKAIHTYAKNETKTLIKGDYSHGTELGEIEASNNVKEVWLISLDLRPDIEEPDLMHSVAKNLSKGRKYHYFYAQDFVEDATKLEEGIYNNLNQTERDVIKKSKSLSLIPLDHKKYKHYLTGNSVAIYEFQNKNGKGAQIDVVGYDEIVLPNERRGSLWQRQLDFRAKSILAVLKGINKGKRSLDILEADTKNDIEIKIIKQEKDFNIVKEIRRNVFMKEQNVTEEEEFDDFDKDAIHLLGYVNKEPVATLRIVEHQNSIQIGRVSVLLSFRGLGIGKAIMNEALSIIDKKDNVKEVFLESQLEKIRFYEKFGFEVVGENFIDARMPHRKMIRSR